ncbi:MAG: tRNA (adenosine(37)-N6)-threonylcarbamoyltransferase complex dimerization subunit type 1 TsaB [Actinomycetota bacterium]|nr:tRNA (adenosine(37)-N6)-threonylcarbamoyltransferase complex dimerization subunit type 1 TsaB [Actinomycetota bacterium]
MHESQLGLSPQGRPLHATRLLEEVEQAVAVAGGWKAVDLLAVGLGPGSFTGLRVGISTARGLSVSLGLPARGVCTLDAVAAGIGEAGATGERLAVLDGWRGEVFAALYSPEGGRIWEPAVYRPEDLAARIAALAEPPSVAGSGAVRFRDELAQGGVRMPDDSDPVHRVAGRHVCALAASMEGEDRDGLAPIYLRPPDAERWRERDASQRAQ